MSFVLLVLGLLATAIGAIAVGFGVPINEFSLGNTLIIAGTTGMMGGLIVIGLALAIRALTNLTQALAGRPLPAAAQGSVLGSAEAPEAVAAPAPPRPLSARTPNQMPARPETPPRPAPAPEPPVVETAPDLPPPVSRPSARPAPSAPVAGDEMPSWRPPRPSGEPAARNEPPARRAAQTNYDAVWPADSRVPPPPAALDMERQMERHAPASGPEPTEPRFEPVSVLKSGVVDGMAYTLYTDGSIEAELAQGVVRFGSIEELRNHLEKNAS
jgi:hypothetical protein